MTITDATATVGRDTVVPIASHASNRRFGAAIVALVLAPLVVGVVSTMTWGRPYLPSWDLALIELMVRDAGRHSVLLGPYSRFGWNHPGPALFYVLAVPYRIFGASSVATDAAAIVVNALAVTGIAIVAWRRGGTLLLACTALPLLLCMRALGPSFLRDPWNPYVTVLPFALLVFLAWSVAVGDAWALPFSVLVASFVVQTHVGYLIAGSALVAAGLLAAAVRVPSARRSSRWRATRRRWIHAGIVAFVTAVLVWIPTALDTVRHRGGNARKIVDWSSAHSGNVGLGDAARIVALQWNTRPEWLFGARRTKLLTDAADPNAGGWVWIVLALGLVCMAYALWRHRRDLVTLGWVLAAGFAGAVVATTRIVGPAAAYLVRWQWALGMVLGVFVLWTGARALLEHGPRPLVVGATIALAAGLVAVATFDSVAAAGGQLPDSNVNARNVSLARQVLAHLGGERGPVYFVDFPGDVQSGLALALTRHHVAVRFAPADQWVVGHWRTGPELGTHVQLAVAEGREQIRAQAVRGDWHQVARWTGHASSRDREVRAHFDELLRTGRITPEAFAALLQLFASPPPDVAVFAHFG